MAEENRPNERMLDAAWTTNDDGAGIAWREPAADGNGLEVVWKKGLGLKEAKDLTREVPLPFVIHFRAASQGGVWANLTHPFEVSEEASDSIEGRTKNPVLFHNGTWGMWADKSMDASIRSGVPVPLGLWNDSRAMAWLSSPSLCGHGFMNFLPEQRGVMFADTWMNVFRGTGGWVAVKDSDGHEFWCSNDRPWKSKHSYHNAGRVCIFGQCKRRDVDSKGYCPEHPDGRLKQLTMAVVSGGAPEVGPFPSQPLRLITLEEAQQMHKDHKISKNLLKGIINMFDRMTNPALSEKQRDKAKIGLEKVSHSMTLTGKAL